MKLSRKAQSIIEYVLVLGLIAGAIFTMQVYVKRSVQAKIKDMTDAFLPPGEVDAGVFQLAHINPVIPLLDEGENKSGYSEQQATITLKTANAGSTLVHESSASASSESHLAQIDPSKDIEVSSGPNIEEVMGR